MILVIISWGTLYNENGYYQFFFIAKLYIIDTLYK